MTGVAKVIGDELDRMGASLVERLLFGTGDPDVIAGVISDFVSIISIARRGALCSTGPRLAASSV